MYFSDFTRTCVDFYLFHSSNKYFSVKTSGVIFYYLIDLPSIHGSDQQKWTEGIISDLIGYVNIFQVFVFVLVTAMSDGAKSGLKFQDLEIQFPSKLKLLIQKV